MRQWRSKAQLLEMVFRRWEIWGDKSGRSYKCQEKYGMRTSGWCCAIYGQVIQVESWMWDIWCARWAGWSGWSETRQVFQVSELPICSRGHSGQLVDILPAGQTAPHKSLPHLAPYCSLTTLLSPGIQSSTYSSSTVLNLWHCCSFSWKPLCCWAFSVSSQK